ncbi:MAG: hypothetical protein Q8R25_00520 [bacterium]|nr:hypothetical protein [bacterium]
MTLYIPIGAIASLFLLANVVGYVIDMYPGDVGEWTTKRSVPLSKKINPVWWFGNDDEQQLPDWYQPEWSFERREFYWTYLRNPLQNFRCYVVGVKDRAYEVKGFPASVWTVQHNDLIPEKRGYQFSVIRLGVLRLPFISYSGEWVVWYVGWQPTGIFGLKFNLRW